MRIVHNILLGIAMLSLVLAMGCCCTGGLDDDEIDPGLPAATAD